MKNIIIRNLEAVKAIDEEEKDSYIVEGYATTWAPYELYEVNGVSYYEQVHQDSLSEADLSDIIFQYDHEGSVLARTSNNTLQIEVDDHGLKVTADLGKSEAGKKLYNDIKEKLVTKMSWRFEVLEDYFDSDTNTRIIYKIKKVYEVGAVALPANNDTSLEARKSDHNGVSQILESKIKTMDLEQLEARKKDLKSQKHNDLIEEEVKLIEERAKEIKDIIETRSKLLHKISNDLVEVRMLESRDNINGNINAERKEENIMENNKKIEVRKFQQELFNTEKRAMTLVNTGSVVPTTIFDKLITDEKYSSLLNKATVLNEQGAGYINIPISKGSKAVWKKEGEAIDPEDANISHLQLGGHELMRLMSASSAIKGMAPSAFQEMFLTLASTEVIEELEASFIKGTGEGESEGLQSLVFDESNQVETSELSMGDIAEAIGKLPNKYSRNAVILVNTPTLYKISQLKGTTEFAFSQKEGVEGILGRAFEINEHLSDNEIYIVDPSQLYVRFAAPLTVDASRDSGFRSATIDLRALAVVDAKWNPYAVVKVSITE